MPQRLYAVALALAISVCASVADAKTLRQQQLIYDNNGRSFVATAKPAERVVRRQARTVRLAVASVPSEFNFRAGNSSIAAVAERYAGQLPDVAELKSWARETGVGAWRWGRRLYCALGVNKVLSDLGMKGTASAAVSSFYRWGSRTLNPQPGDVAIVGAQHVAIVVGRSAGGVDVVSFNDAGHRVLRRTYPLRGIQYRSASL